MDALQQAQGEWDVLNEQHRRGGTSNAITVDWVNSGAALGFEVGAFTPLAREYDYGYG